MILFTGKAASPSVVLLLSLGGLLAALPGQSPAAEGPSAARGQPLAVYILAGQSNMQGHAKIGTFEHIGMDPATQPLLAEMLGPGGRPTVCERVWISSIGCADAEQTGRLTAGFGATPEKIGPEFTFGLTMRKFTAAPILLIKTSWGGKSLHSDFRPPSAGPYVFNETQLDGFRKQGKLMETMRTEGLTDRERLVIEKGISNFEFHYLGSAKILGGVGKGLAEAMADLNRPTEGSP